MKLLWVFTAMLLVSPCFAVDKPRVFITVLTNQLRTTGRHSSRLTKLKCPDLVFRLTFRLFLPYLVLPHRMIAQGRRVLLLAFPIHTCLLNSATCGSRNKETSSQHPFPGS
jgi:hypothetical protein